MADFLNHLPTILWGLIALYGLSVAVFILLENRSPHLTLTWLFVFIFMPVIGVVVYIFFGRGFTLFSGRDKLIKQELTTRLSQERAPLLERQDEAIKRLKQAGPPVYGRVVELMRRNADSPLCPHNCLEILQTQEDKIMRQLLQHPALQKLEPRTPRETLLFIKAHTLGLEAACTAINTIGLENFEVLFDQALPDMWQNVDACAAAEVEYFNKDLGG